VNEVCVGAVVCECERLLPATTITNNHTTYEKKMPRKFLEQIRRSFIAILPFGAFHSQFPTWQGELTNSKGCDHRFSPYRGRERANVCRYE